MRSKWKDRFVFCAVLTAIFSFVYFDTARNQEKRVAPGSLEYEAYIRRMADNCVHEGMQDDPDNKASLTYQRRLAFCMELTRKYDPYYPTARPYRK
ncbi:MAG: hypothetical protein OXS28_00925 [Gammaproteobacteria bacterium]|nr:hypothetical protein [Gammaproteobacteria bacterium]